MSTFKRKSKDKNFTVEVIDHNGVVRWIAAFPNKIASREFESQVRSIIAMKRMGLELEEKQVQFLEGCSVQHLKNFVRWGLIPDTWVAGEKTVLGHIQDWYEFQASKAKRGLGHVIESFDRVWRVSEECSWKKLPDTGTKPLAVYLAPHSTRLFLQVARVAEARRPGSRQLRTWFPRFIVQTPG